MPKIYLDFSLLEKNRRDIDGRSFCVLLKHCDGGMNTLGSLTPSVIS